MTIPLWYGGVCALAAAYFGFWYGRSRNWGILGGTKEAEETGENRHKKTGVSEKTLSRAKYLASPASGTVEELSDEGSRGARILTTDSKLFSPSAGRVLSIAPRGNAFLILTDFGAEVEVRACTSEDDLLDRYFRPRVIRGEIIRRGRLLLEYDREKLSKECEDTATYLTAKGEDCTGMELVGGGQVKAGDALFWVNEKKE
ncbi:MAG: PTS glucose transporter subunit IIA [Acetatifactor sp.]|nr:PTS glucose transporter subunit IIA [Acetatifactor sp.]